MQLPQVNPVCIHSPKPIVLFSTGSSWLRPYPKGLRATLNWLREEYDNVTVYITENGVSDHTGSLRDEYRITYIKQHVNELLKGS